MSVVPLTRMGSVTLGQWIKKERLLRGWSQAQFAGLLHVNRSAISQWESGVTSPHRLRRDDLESWFGEEIPVKIAKATWG